MEDKIIIGKIGAVRGLNGELKLIPLTDFEDRFDNLKTVDIDSKTLQIDYVKSVGKNLIIRLVLKYNYLNLKSEAAPLAEGEFYTFDIIGLEVSDLNGNKLGVVNEVLKTGSNDVFAAKSDDGREILIPALKRVIKKIDIENKSMLIDTEVLEEV